MKELLKAKSEFRKRGVTLTADKQKQGGGGSWKFAGEDNLLKTIQEPLSSVGLEVIATLKAIPELNLNMVVVTLFHVDSGESLESSKVLDPVLPKKDRNSNPMYLDAEIEVGKQFGYWSRILTIRILGISDIDPEDHQNIPNDISDEAKEKKEKQPLLDYLNAVKEKAKDPSSFENFIKTQLDNNGVDNLKEVSVAKLQEIKSTIQAMGSKK